MKKFDEYDKISVATDLVLLASSFKDGETRKSSQLSVECLLVRSNENDQAFNGKWALTGGFVDNNETLTNTLINKVYSKAGITPSYKEQLYTYGDKLDRDSRGRVISVVYIATVYKPLIQMDKEHTHETKWAELKVENGKVRLEHELAFDHNEILQDGYDRIKHKILWTDIVFSLLPEEFTMSQAQKIYEFFTGEPMLNIRRTLLNKVESTGKMETQKQYRPSELFRRKQI